MMRRAPRAARVPRAAPTGRASAPARVLVLAVAPALACGLVLGSCERRIWSSDSAAATAELEAGLEARMKLYHADAQEHLERALELDPGFAVAKALLLSPPGYAPDKERREQLVADLGEVDFEALSSRERFLVRYSLERSAENGESEALLDSYLEEYPDDPFALDFLGQALVQRNDLDAAEEVFARLTRVEPNWVRARNWLGYIAMFRGDFEVAEEHFRSYQYIAPDQANPHDSMGEMLLVVGRYEEAERELEAALALRPDFWVSYSNLVDLWLLQRDRGRAEEVLGRAVETGLDPADASRVQCRIESFGGLVAGEWEAVWQTSNVCQPGDSLEAFELYKAAVRTGREKEAEEVHQEIQRRLLEGQEPEEVGEPFRRGSLAHLEGLAQRRAGRPAAAAAAFRLADGAWQFRSRQASLLKLLNRVELADALATAGDSVGARAAFAAVLAVNPRFGELLGRDRPRAWSESGERSRIRPESAAELPPRPGGGSEPG